MSETAFAGSTWAKIRILLASYVLMVCPQKIIKDYLQKVNDDILVAKYRKLTKGFDNGDKPV